MGSSQKAILQTLLYSDIFSFPLTKEEILTFLISDESINNKLVTESILNMRDHIVYSNGYYAIKGKENIINKRIALRKEAERKLKLAKNIVGLLSIIPTISLVGVSGGLAVGDVDVEDDIDLFVITSKNTLWLTRLCILILLELKGVRRTRLGKKVSNTFCVNMMIEEGAALINPDQRNVYTAKEIAQMLPLFERGNMYKSFLTQNNWIKNFLPNALFDKEKIVISMRKKRKNNFSNIFYLLLDKIAQEIQLSKIMRNRTNETITDKLIAFHPTDYKKIILKKFENKIREYSL